MEYSDRVPIIHHVCMSRYVHVREASEQRNK